MLTLKNHQNITLLMLFKQPVLHPFNTVYNKPGGAVVSTHQQEYCPRLSYPVV